jgi:F-type H+-transporting ATPase subunit delta
MSKAASAKRYAKALIEAAKEHNAVSEIKTSYAELVEILKEHSDIQMLLNHPQVNPEDKKAMLTSLLKEANPLFLNFIQLIVDKGREALLTEIYQKYLTLVNELEGIAEATVRSAVPLDPQVLDGISQAFSRQLGKKVRATNIVDKSIIGGIEVRIGDRLYDGSIKGKLDRFSKQLSVQ